MSNVQLQFRRGTDAEWTGANPILASGEVGYETNTSKMKIGDGTTPWNSLPYFAGGGGGGTGLSGYSGTAGTSFDFDGGAPETNYALGPVFDCGTIT